MTNRSPLEITCTFQEGILEAHPWETATVQFTLSQSCPINVKTSAAIENGALKRIPTKDPALLIYPFHDNATARKCRENRQIIRISGKGK